MREYSSYSIGGKAADALKDPDSRGKVVGVFSNSFYVRTVEDELIFVTNRDLKSQLTINVETADDWSRIVQPLDWVSFRTNEICVGKSAKIHVNRGSCWYEGVNVGPHSTLQGLVSNETLLLLSFILRIIDQNLSILDPTGVSYEGAVTFVRDGIISLVHAKTASHFHNQALRIVGLGGGFTASGDDLLSGFLATYNSLANHVGRPEILLDFDMLQDRTSWISARLLDYMQRLIMDEQMNRLIVSSISGDADSFISCAESILPRGHTSGIDILVGVVLALSVVREIISNTPTTPKIANRLGLLGRSSDY